MVLPIAAMTTSSTRSSSLSTQVGSMRRMASSAALVETVSPARNLESAEETRFWVVTSMTGTLGTTFMASSCQEPSPEGNNTPNDGVCQRNRGPTRLPGGHVCVFDRVEPTASRTGYETVLQPQSQSAPCGSNGTSSAGQGRV